MKAFSIAGVIACALAASDAVADNYNVHVTGDIFCSDNGTVAPLAHARIEMMDSDADGSTIFDDTMGQSTTDGSGHFDFSGSGGDPGSYSWSRPDVYVRVTLSDEDLTPFPVRLTDELNSARSWDSPEHDHDNVEGDVVIGSFTWGTSYDPNAVHNSSQCGVWLKARKEYLDYTSIAGQYAPPYHYDVEYWTGVFPITTETPWTNTDTTHWPRHYVDIPTVTHEFGHAIRHSLDGNQDEFNLDVVRFVYAQSHDLCDSHNQGFAFNEGWAEYWADTVGCNKTLHPDVEGDVADALKAMSECTGGRSGMLTVLQNNPGSIHSIGEFANALQKIVSDCGAIPSSLGSSSSGLHVEPHLPREKQIAWTQATIDDLQKAGNEASRKSEELRATADRLRAQPCADVEACRAVTQAIIDAISWRVRSRLLALAEARLRGDIANVEATSTRLANGTFTAWYASDKAAYLDKLRTETLSGLREARDQVVALAASSRAATVFVAPLRAKLALAEAAPSLPRARRIAYDPIVADGGETVKRGGPTPTPPPRKPSCSCGVGRASTPLDRSTFMLFSLLTVAIALTRRIRRRLA